MTYLIDAALVLTAPALFFAWAKADEFLAGWEQ